ncbi:MAG: phosphonate C-P lyase system protein PhnG [Marinibacterium sp.]|nr:phosphonate C-P lyase system protein PhnG [Marinibacterium sp.]
MTDFSQSDRQAWMSLIAKAPEARLDALWSGYGAAPTFEWLRRPEIGAVMVRGRMGAAGDAFNLGEMTVTRCSVKLEDGAVGHGYVQGRSKAKAEQAALIDALMQGAGAAALRVAVLDPLAAEARAQAAARAAKAAATKVEFFTMVRGEDA